MAEIWRTHDRLGREVVFTSDGRDHILSRHEDMAGRLEQIRTVIEQAATVSRDLQYRRRENHYLLTATRRSWLKVVVQYRPVPPQGTWEGEIITAFRVKQPDPREEMSVL